MFMRFSGINSAPLHTSFSTPYIMQQHRLSRQRTQRTPFRLCLGSLTDILLQLSDDAAEVPKSKASPVALFYRKENGGSENEGA